MRLDRHHVPLLLIGLAVALVLALLRPIDGAAREHAEAGLQRALLTFAAARVINSALSLAQSASIEVGAGISGSVHPGAVLEPLDDMVELFSSLMLGATLSFAVQRLLIEVMGGWAVPLLLGLVWLAWIALQWRSRKAPPWLTRLAVGLLCVRLAVPVVALGSEAAYRLLLDEDYRTSQAQIEAAAPSLPEVAGSGVIDTVRSWLAKSADIGRSIAELKDLASRWIEHMLRLAAIFIVQTLLLPLLFVWLMLQLYRRLGGFHATTSPLPAATARP